MKERFVLAVSWWCFAHASLVGFLLISYQVFDVGPRDLGVINDLVQGYFDLFPETALVIGFPFIGWLVLWIVTGSPRILPRKQVATDD